MFFDYWLINHYNEKKEVVEKMSDKINMYKNVVIMPIEEKRNLLRKEILKENIFMKSKKIDLLKKYDALLIEKYQKLEEMIEEENKKEKKKN